MPERPQRPDEMAWYATLAQLGMEMVVPIGLGLLLDYRLDTLPWLAVGGAVLGFVGGMVHMVYVMNRANRNKPDAGQRGSPL